MTASTIAPRIPPGGRREVGAFAAAVARVSGLVTGTDDPNLFLTLARHRRLFRGWLWFAGALMPRGHLARRETELVILRTAHRRGCEYEFEHHRRLGARTGVTAGDIAALTGESPAGAARTPREAAILEAADQLLDRRDIDDDTWDRLAAGLDDRQLVELVFLVGHYDMLATAIATLRIRPDPPRRG